MLVDLTDRVVLVTGGGRGIGRALAERFVAEGAKVAAFDVAFPEGAPEGVLQIEGDVTEPDSVADGVARVAEHFGGIDVLINNAGINVEGRVEDLDPAAWRRCFDVNVAGVFLMSQAVLPHVKASDHGRILNAASFAAIVPSVGAAAYGASKAAVVQFTRVLAGELGPWGVTVNAYAPGMVPSAMNGFETMPQATQDRLLDTLTLRRWGTADSIADLLVFLASDAADYITGTLVDVSGGKLATQLPQRAYEGAVPPAS
ncbi:SDR family NAD(P)-dependent oxidoreductase [Rathayibacter sp. VKM Ac-2760]|uniref:SDR family NAD(P)-dependent oxidoreductase n=1 Tax=Rathayibacter sp. VKM Ac-2760 TaxID=2609253 RepID=UPI0013169238|nr:SDR family NAD(P)-dependent oxidoreductase [Rathayibacter sp. VKM Ac-2760]QHC57346.1 SDR family oxidoreductase [Rathayibacter sp. VKM Ac-2760]